MEFDKEAKVIIDTLSREEALDYIEFLEIEIERHRDAVNGACRYRYYSNKVVRKLWDSAIDRHEQDIEKAQKRIDTVRIKFLGL